MLRDLVFLLCFMLVAVPIGAAEKETDRLENSAVVMEEIMNVPDNIPQDLLDKAECVIVVPSVKKAAFGIGGSYGRGAMVCRTGGKFKGQWGAPSMLALEGGSVGFQLGGEATDLILLVMNKKGAESILSSQVKLGGDASSRLDPKAVMLKRLPMPSWERRYSATLARKACLPVSLSQALRFAPTMTPTNGFTAAKSRPKKSCWTAKSQFPRQDAI
jgi:hypothetical protein